MNNNTYCVIMAGGVGSRFWPLSRSHMPKQFLDILGTGKTLIRQTVDRFSKICPIENIYIVSNAFYKDLILEQLPELKPEQVLLEPLMKNTAPCLAYANQVIFKKNPDASIIVAPSDHLITDEIEFGKVIDTAISFVSEKEVLLTLGIQPSRPETGYGYIQVDGIKDIAGIACLREVKTFTEKPNLDIAKIFLESGDFFWNSGIFIWSVKSIIDAFKKHLPDMQSLFEDGHDKYGTPEEAGFIEQVYGSCDKISIDYGIMEKAENVYVLCANIGWSDLGTWGSLYEHSDRDAYGNSQNSSQFMPFNTSNSMVQLPEGKLGVIQGLDEYIVVDTEDVLLICKKEDEQKIRQMVDEVKMLGGEKYI
ncbi:MAG: NTP transferase domain-containing protein [Bacteroidetes bacterium]|nr:NTP transferase domain-containing protein [Bacteroidota bacterium]